MIDTPEIIQLISIAPNYSQVRYNSKNFKSQANLNTKLQKAIPTHTNQQCCKGKDGVKADPTDSI